jgi:hypothetical protein
MMPNKKVTSFVKRCQNNLVSLPGDENWSNHVKNNIQISLTHDAFHTGTNLQPPARTARTRTAQPSPARRILHRYTLTIAHAHTRTAQPSSTTHSTQITLTTAHAHRPTLTHDAFHTDNTYNRPHAPRTRAPPIMLYNPRTPATHHPTCTYLPTHTTTHVCATRRTSAPPRRTIRYARTCTTQRNTNN